MHSGLPARTRTCNSWLGPFFITTQSITLEFGTAMCSSLVRVALIPLNVTELIHYAAADAGSIYEPHPILAYEWDPEHTDDHRRERTTTSTSFDLGPHPADPQSITSVALNSQFRRGPFSERQQVPGHEIWVYAGRGGYVIAYRVTHSVSESCPPPPPKL